MHIPAGASSPTSSILLILSLFVPWNPRCHFSNAFIENARDGGLDNVYEIESLVIATGLVPRDV